MMNRRRILMLGLLGLAACASFSDLVKSGVKDPKLTFEDASLQSISLDSATVLASFKVENPNSFGLDLAGGSYGFSLDGQKLFDGNLDQGIKLPASSTSTLKIPVRVPYNSVPNLLTTLATKDSAPYQVDGTVKIRTPISDIPLPFAWKGNLPIPKMPKMSVSNARLENVSLSGARLVVSLGVNNPNSFPVPLEKVAANLKVQGQSVTQMGLTAPKELAPKQVTTVDIPVDLPMANAGVAISRALSGSSTAVQLDGAAVMGGKELPFNLSTTVH